MVSATDSIAYRKYILMRISSPGRFFAAFELKAMLVYAILHYDLKLEGPRLRAGVRESDLEDCKCRVKSMN